MNFEGISLKKNFWRFVWPLVVAQWIFALYTMVDGMFVARGVSESALAAVNIVSPFVNFLFSVSILFAVGTSTIVAIYLGQGRRLEANQANTQNLIVSGAVSLLITLAMWLGVDPAIRFLGATEATMEYARHYILSILPFAWCFIISYTFETLVKTDGYPRFATIVVSLGAVINCILDYLFVMVFHWGVAGAGVATGISQMIPVFIYLKHFLGPKATIRFAKPRWDLGQMVRVMKIGLSSGLTELSAGLTVFMFNHAILRYIGEQGVVSYTIVAYVNMIVVMSMAGISQGIQPLISFYYGRQEHDVCKKLLRCALCATTFLAGAAFFACMGGANLLVGVFFSRELADLRAYSAAVFRIFSSSFMSIGCNIVG
ncbi:MAG: MATE family efflux transporter, partial [Clostridium sp.]|nr:MATE family efflux transporter [Clostridium sp.]